MKEDKTLKCCECGADFVFSASEQEFYEEKGFTNEPRRCPACRQARKQRMGIATERPQREMFPQYVLSAVKKPWFLSVLLTIVRYIAAIASTHKKLNFIA